MKSMLSLSWRSAYERLLGDALRGDRMLFGNQEAVEAAWRIVDPVLDNVTPLGVYEQRSWDRRKPMEPVSPYDPK